MGAVTVGLLFLLARILFRRRSIAVLVALFALLDGMFFVQSRIAMNDVYVGAFILAAYCAFAWLWIKPERPRWAFWTLMPMIGVFLGLALASKWVAAYAIGALGILILARSALGRLLLIFGMIGLTGVLGWMAMAVPAGSEASGNLLFTLIMIALTLATVVVTIYHPIAWSDEEMWLAVAGPGAIGILIAFVSIVLGRAGKTYARRPDPVHAARGRLRVRPRRDPRVRGVPGGRPIRIRAHGEDAGAGRPAPPAAARVAAGNRLAAAGVGPRHPRRVDAGIPAGDPDRGLRDHVHPVGVRRGPPDHQGLAARPHGPDPARPHRGDVPVPQRPDGAAPGELAVVGLAAQPQAGLVLPGQLRQLDRRPRSTTRAT